MSDRGERRASVAMALLLAGAVACSAHKTGAGFETIPADDAGTETDSATTETEAGTVDAPATPQLDASGWMLQQDASSPAPGACAFQDSVDHDGDGFSFAQGDCNDCDKNTNPGAFDVPKNGVDEDCNGKVDDEPTGCDGAIALDSSSAFDAARALDLCRTTTETASGKARTWGVVSAEFVAPDGTDQCPSESTGVLGIDAGNPSCASNTDFALGHGNLTKLGVVKPRVGSRMLGLSSGTARDPGDVGYSSVSGFNKGYTTGAAPGFPAPAPACPGIITGQPHDGAALKLTIRVPTNAKSFSVAEDFFSFEFPGFICSTYNDTFVVEMSPAPAVGAGDAGTPGGDIAFDSDGNPICVNNGLLQVCDPQMAGGKTFTCPLGPSQLVGTGFGMDTGGGDHAATGWLTTTVNVDASLRGKEITLLFAIWDSGDGSLDSTAVLDGFTWSTEAGKTVPVTQPTTAPM